jgi:hypothetical protein
VIVVPGKLVNFVVANWPKNANKDYCGRHLKWLY